MWKECKGRGQGYIPSVTSDIIYIHWWSMAYNVDIVCHVKYLELFRVWGAGKVTDLATKIIFVCIWCLCGLGQHLWMDYKNWQKGNSINLLWFIIDSIGFSIFGPVAILMIMLSKIDIPGKKDKEGE